MRLIKKCAELPMLDEHSPEETFRYKQNHMDVWDNQ